MNMNELIEVFKSKKDSAKEIYANQLTQGNNETYFSINIVNNLINALI